MDYDEFIGIVEQVATGREEAERATRATLETLAERVSAAETRHLVEQLPPELGPWLASPTPAEAFDVDEFLRRVAEREGTDIATAERHSRVVFAALARAVDAAHFAHVANQLSKDFALVLPRGRRSEILPIDAFLSQVSARTGLDANSAQRATEAVLETLGERIAGGDVDHLTAQLPVELHPPLKRGRSHSLGNPQPMSAAEFVERVARREAVTHDQAEDHARAVLATLSHAIPTQEFLDLTVQLPSEYRLLLA
jgi:uncharacterized protein (DUF2267 family)